eukprot:223706-Alexandrium_andersonii.AAC.1
MVVPAAWRAAKSTAATAELPWRKPGWSVRSGCTLGTRWTWVLFSLPTLYLASSPSLRMLGTKFSR